MLFFASKTLNFFIDPLNTQFLLLVIIFLSLFFNKNRISKYFSCISIAFWLFISYYPLPYYFLRNLENEIQKQNFSASDLDGVIVLGGGVGTGLIPEDRDEASLGSASERIIKSIELFYKNPNLKILYSGYSGEIFHVGWPEYKTAFKLLTDMGVPEKNIILEKRSRNTYENLFNSSKFLNSNSTWGIITSAYHMKRTSLIVNSINIDSKIIYIPVDYQTTKIINFAGFNWGSGRGYWHLFLHELIGLYYYKMLGRIK